MREMSRRKLERIIKTGNEHAKETVHDFTSLEQRSTFKFGKGSSGVYSLQFSLDTKFLVVGHADGSIQALDCADSTLRQHKELRARKYGGLPVTCLRFSPRQHHIVYASSSSGFVYTCNMTDGSLNTIAEEEKNEINGLDFNSTGEWFATGGRDLCVRLYDVQTSKLLHRWAGHTFVTEASDTHSQRIFCVKFLPDDRDVFVTGGWDNQVKMWDGRLEHPVMKIFSGPHICGDSIDISGHRMLTGSWTQHDALQIWDVRYNKVLQMLPFHVEGGKPGEDTGAYLYCAQFADRNTVLAGGSGTHSVQAISVTQNKVIGELKLHGLKPHTASTQSPCPGKQCDNIVQALDSTDGGRQVVFGGVSDVLVCAGMGGGKERGLTREELAE